MEYNINDLDKIEKELNYAKQKMIKVNNMGWDSQDVKIVIKEIENIKNFVNGIKINLMIERIN
jgi:hypothetical protein